jgi:hypothetical protein
VITGVRQLSAFRRGRQAAERTTLRTGSFARPGSPEGARSAIGTAESVLAQVLLRVVFDGMRTP